MSKIIINSIVFSKNEKENLNGIKAILKDNKINYVNDGVNVSIMLLKNKIILERENKDMKLDLEFEKDKTLTTKYVIKELGIEIKVETQTKELSINDNDFKVKYDLFMNGEFSDTFTYEVKWSDLE